MTLFNGKCGESYLVRDICLEENAKRRFEILGLTHNSEVKIMGHKKSGSMIIKIRGTRFAIGKSFADGIFVVPELQKTKEKREAEIL